MKLDSQEIATILAALRHLQTTTAPGTGWMVREIAPELFEAVEPLEDEAIDDLCEKLNCEGGE